MMCEPIGSRYLRSPLLPWTKTCGERFSAPTVSTMMRWARPVTRSVSSRRFSPSMMSRYAIFPPTSVRIADVYGSHSTSSWPGTTSWRVRDLDRRSVDDRVTLLLAALVVHDQDLAVAVDDDEVAVLALDRRDAQEPDRARVLRRVLRLLRDARRGSAVVERPHRQLRAGLADRLRGDDAHRLADLDHLARGEHAAVAEPADAALGLAGQHRPDLDPLDPRLLDGRGQILADFLADAEDLHLGQRIEDVFLSDAADDAVAQRLERVAAFHDRA